MRGDRVKGSRAHAPRSGQAAEQVVETIFASMTEAMEQGEGIEVRGFGSFTVRPYKSYRGRNPKTGVPVEVSAKRVPFFKAGKELREIVNAGRHHPLVDSRTG